MSTIVLLVRILVCFALFCSPLFLYIVASRKSENALWLLFPLFGGIPATLGALFVFIPLEGFLDAQGLGHLKNVAIPLSGSLLIVIFLVLSCVVSGNYSMLSKRMLNGGLREIWPILFWSILGVVWGASWRLSDWIIRSIGLPLGLELS